MQFGLEKQRFTNLLISIYSRSPRSKLKTARVTVSTPELTHFLKYKPATQESHFPLLVDFYEPELINTNIQTLTTSHILKRSDSALYQSDQNEEEVMPQSI